MRFPVARLLGICLLCTPFTLPAQQLDPDAEGCKDSKLLTRMRGCVINQCSNKDFDAVEVQIGVKDGEPQMKNLEGQVESITYQCPANISMLQVVRNADAALRKAGFKIVFSGKGYADRPLVTAQKEGLWVQTATQLGDFYTQTVARVQQMAQEMQASAEAWAEEIAKTGRVAIYGINFETGKAAIQPDSEKVLAEIVTLLTSHPDWKMRVEGHTDNVGEKAFNQALSERRAAAVVDWLVSHGIDKSRLAAQGFGDTRPVAENTTDEGRAKNRRVDLAKI